MKRVVVGLSGGVDSAVCAYLLKKEGYEVFGVTMKQFNEAPFIEDAKKVAEHLGINFRVVDISKKFTSEIMDYFCDEYKNGRTPNPCTFCNPRIKWEVLTRVSKEACADYIATGHYANIDCINGRFSIKNAKTATKDQTYALCMLSQEQLSKTLMPLGAYEKDEVRVIAKEAGIPVAEKADSQDICFIPDGDYAAFLKDYGKITPVKGNFTDSDGKILGKHEGIINYTIGQRKGLGLAMGHPVFVTGLNASKNEVIIGENEDLFKTVFYCSKMNFMSGTEEDIPRKLVCKIRYAHKGTHCLLEKTEKEGTYKCTFEEPVRAITPGQTAVFYDGEYVFAGGTIGDGNFW